MSPNLPASDHFMFSVTDSGSAGLPASGARLAVVLHAHTPFVAAPLRRHGHAETLYAFIAQTIIPLLNTLHRLAGEEINAPTSLVLSPICCEMLSDLSLPTEFEKYLHRHIEICRAHGREFAGHGMDVSRALALFWENWFQGIERDYEEKFNRDLIGAFRELQNEGRLELLTAPATGALLTALPDETAVEAQLQIGIDSYKKYFGRPPRGLWLPASNGDETQISENYLARALARHGFDYWIAGAPNNSGEEATRYLASTSALLRAVLGEANEVQSGPPLWIEEGVAALRPHAGLTEQVWNRELGYCGDEQFLDAARRLEPGALRLWRITDNAAPPSRREAYEPFGNSAICEAQAEHWLDRVREFAAESGNGQPLCAAFDADFFGAQWFEGPNWLYRTLKKAAADPTIELVTAGDATNIGAFDSTISQTPPAESALDVNPAPASSPFAAPSLWFNAQTAWLWPEIDDAHRQLKLMAQTHRETGNAKLAEILNQCGREVLLMQSIDWPLALSTQSGTAAASRFAEHADTLRALLQIAQTVAQGQFMTEGERAFLASATDRDDLFPELSFALWSA